MTAPFQCLINIKLENQPPTVTLSSVAGIKLHAQTSLNLEELNYRFVPAANTLEPRTIIIVVIV